MDDGDHFDHIVTHSVYQPVRRLDDFANVWRVGLPEVTPRFRKVLDLLQSANEPIDRLLGIDRRHDAYILGNRRELLDCVLRPPERPPHDARRIRLRTRDNASSCETVRPASASAIPASIAWRTYTSYARSSHVAVSGRPSTSLRASALMFGESGMVERWRVGEAPATALVSGAGFRRFTDAAPAQTHASHFTSCRFGSAVTSPSHARYRSNSRFATAGLAPTTFSRSPTSFFRSKSIGIPPSNTIFQSPERIAA